MCLHKLVTEWIDPPKETFSQWRPSKAILWNYRNFVTHMKDSGEGLFIFNCMTGCVCVLKILISSSFLVKKDLCGKVVTAQWLILTYFYP